MPGCPETVWKCYRSVPPHHWNWTLHDLRRTFSSILAASGVDQIVVEKILGHTTGGSQSAVAQIYNRHAYMNEMRDAMLLMQDHLDNLLEPEH